MGGKWFSKCPKCGAIVEVEFHEMKPEGGAYGTCTKCGAEFYAWGVWREGKK